MANEYVLLSDSACDMTPETLAAWGVRTLPLLFRLGDNEEDLPDGALDGPAFYAEMRAGKVSKTSAQTITAYTDFFRPALDEGKDVFFLAFSSALSSTFHNAELAAEDLMAEYPGRRVMICDSRSASAGQGLLLHLTVNKRDEGATLDELTAYVEEMRFRVNHWFTVDDLMFLKRGGRISAATAIVGGMLQIKPVLNMDDGGHLVPMLKVRGRKAAVASLLDKYVTTCTDKSLPVYISHGDSPADAAALADMIVAAGGPRPVSVFIGPVIGSHSGPGTLSLFFVGEKR